MSLAQLRKAIKENVLKNIGKSIEQSITEIVTELPKGNNSSIANALKYEKVSDTEYNLFITDRVWSYLNYVTGIYNPDHAGAGEGGMIIPTGNAKVLHFKNANLAMALGFPDENVFLAKVKGIKPFYFFERMYDTNRFSDILLNNVYE